MLGRADHPASNGAWAGSVCWTDGVFCVRVFAPQQRICAFREILPGGYAANVVAGPRLHGQCECLRGAVAAARVRVPPLVRELVLIGEIHLDNGAAIIVRIDARIGAVGEIPSQIWLHGFDQHATLLIVQNVRKVRTSRRISRVDNAAKAPSNRMVTGVRNGGNIRDRVTHTIQAVRGHKCRIATAPSTVDLPTAATAQARLPNVNAVDNAFPGAVTDDAVNDDLHDPFVPIT